jgi:hypothetical protein
MDQAIYSLIYVSTAVDKLSKESFSSLANQSSLRNHSLGVTGLLLYSDGNFMQCLEGPKYAIDSLMKSITSDSRLLGLVVLCFDKIQIREFPDWDMAVRSPDAGLTKLANSQTIDAWLNTSVNEQKSFARVLLENFWRGVNGRNCNH